jgi:uncharacterized membrane protein YphA (DoxX/SURF4 family)
MRLIAFLLMVSGWLLLLAALLLLGGLRLRFTFAASAVFVELLGLALLAHRYRSIQRGPQ